MRQGTLFDILPPENPDSAVGLIGVMPAIRSEMNRVADKFEPGRKVLVDAIMEVAKREGVALTPGGGKTLTIDILNKWLQPKDYGHPPTYEAIMCFCRATGDASPMKPLLKAMGLTAIPMADLKYLEYGKDCAAELKVKKSKKKWEALL